MVFGKLQESPLEGNTRSFFNMGIGSYSSANQGGSGVAVLPQVHKSLP